MNELNPIAQNGSNVQPFVGPANWLRHEIDRLFDTFEAPARTVFGLGGRGAMPMPALEMTEDKKGYSLAVELPGMDEKDVEIGVADGVLTISGEKKEEQERKENGYLLSERRYGQFVRKVALPDDVDPAGISAAFKRGVLKISMAKDSGKSPRTRKIAIEAAKD